jgi:monothiol glutaredoxin
MINTRRVLMSLKETIENEIKENKILIYGKGTKEAPRCGFTMETIQFFQKYGYPFAVVDVLNDMEKRNLLSQMTNWPTLPKVFIDGQFYGDTDVLDEMEKKGEVKPLLDKTFGKA